MIRPVIRLRARARKTDSQALKVFLRKVAAEVEAHVAREDAVQVYMVEQLSRLVAFDFDLLNDGPMRDAVLAGGKELAYAQAVARARALITAWRHRR